MLGHVDSWSGGSVFFKIKDLNRGDKVDVIRANGSTAVFTVDGLQKAVKVAFPTSPVYGSPGYPALRLITCGGPFDAATGAYLDNIIVYAHLTSEAGLNPWEGMGSRPPGQPSTLISRYCRLWTGARVTGRHMTGEEAHIR